MKLCSYNFAAAKNLKNINIMMTMTYCLKTTFAPALIGLMLAVSCNTAEPERRDRITLAESSLSQGEAMSQFASILSQAAADNEDLRTFIRNQALEMFDNDYDVFYPFVKDVIVSGGKTFSQMLSEYCTSETQLLEIEAAVPKLTILVPDWEWLDAFSVNNWDTADSEVLVGYAESGETRTLYKDGEANSIGDWEFPLSPTIIIKSNERMVVNGVTKSGERTFAFKYPEFDKRNNPLELQTKGRTWNSDEIELPVTEFVGNFVPTSDIDPLVIGAYNEFKDGSIPNACHRDYIYYGMSKSNRDSGILNTGIRERLYRFRIDPGSFSTIADDANDPKLSNMITVKGRSKQLSKQQLLNKVWSNGSFNFKLDFYIANAGRDTTTLSDYLLVQCPASALFDLSKVQRTYKKQTAVAQGVYKYEFKADDLISKWYYPSNIQRLPAWDISQESNSIRMQIYEVDDETEIEMTEEWSYNYSQNFNFTGNASADVSLEKVGIKASFGVGADTGKEKRCYTKIVTRKKKVSNEIGIGYLEYQDRLVENAEKNDN